MIKSTPAPVTPRTALQPIEGEKNFRAWLRSLCAASSLREVAERAGIQPSQLSNIIAGRGSLGPKTVGRFHYRRQVDITFVPIEKGDN